MAHAGTPAKTFMDLPIVQTHLKAAGEMVGENAASRYVEATHRCMSYSWALQFDSPLELLFWIWWGACEVDAQYYPIDQMRLERQVGVEAGGERFRLDFVVELFEPKWQPARDAGLLVWPKIAVELDGHEFHERTREQVASRDKRDRLLQQAGWTVFHYSWGEFTKEPQRCAQEVFDLASTTAVELYRQFAQEVPSKFGGGGGE